MSDYRYDLIYGASQVPHIEHHFCREVDDGFGNGCFGTNLDHGYTWDEVIQALVDWHAWAIERIAQAREEEFNESGIL